MISIPSAKPFFGSNEDIEAILSDIEHTLRDGHLTRGPWVAAFEEAFAQYVGVQHSVAVTNGTAALEIALRYFDVRGRDVIVPTNTFLSTANAVLFAGGKPLLADISGQTLCLDLDTFIDVVTPKVTGVIVVHIAGLVCPHIYEIRDYCSQRGLFLIEDAAHAHGAMLNKQKAGSIGQAGCFSFFPTKLMTTGEGGMITTDDDGLAEFARNYRNHGVPPSAHLHLQLGHNWRMPEINAILGVHQLRQLDGFLARRQQIACRYDQGLRGVEGIKLFVNPPSARHSYYKYPIIVEDGIGRDRLAQRLLERHGIHTGSVYYPPCHLQPIYRELFGYDHGMLPVAEQVLPEVLCLPVFVQMRDEDVDYVLAAVKEEVALLSASLQREEGESQMAYAEAIG
jgi:perosamine synthetase